MTEPIVSLANVDMRFTVPGGGETVALKNINLTIQPGEFVSLIGPSGCGKSTLLRLVGDLITPTAGAVTVNGTLSPGNGFGTIGTLTVGAADRAVCWVC